MGAMALSVAAFAGPKAYDVVITNPVTAGNQQINSGDYKVRVEGANAVFTDEQTHKSFTVPVKVENADKKYDATAVETTTQGQTVQMNAIDLGGSKMKLEFGQ